MCPLLPFIRSFFSCPADPSSPRSYFNIFIEWEVANGRLGTNFLPRFCSAALTQPTPRPLASFAYITLVPSSGNFVFLYSLFLQTHHQCSSISVYMRFSCLYCLPFFTPFFIPSVVPPRCTRICTDLLWLLVYSLEATLSRPPPHWYPCARCIVFVYYCMCSVGLLVFIYDCCAPSSIVYV